MCELLLRYVGAGALFLKSHKILNYSFLRTFYPTLLRLVLLLLLLS